MKIVSEVRCWRAEIECGVPAQCSPAHLVAQTGRSYFDVAVYRCDAASVTGSVCQLDGTWSTASSKCVDQEDFVVTQQRPFVPPSRH